MRPLSLTLQGFRSYAGSHTFDFTGRSLVGVVGPIGSGKSSLLDAIAFALYGRTPTVARGIRSLINQRMDLAQVELTFEVDGDEWRAVRALRARGQSGHALYRGETPEALQERTMTSRVEELLGLDFAGFRRSVLLAQNQFAGFLNAPPGDRDAVLRGVFGFDRITSMHAIARERENAAARDIEELERRRREIDQDRDALAAVRPELAAAAERLEGLTEAAVPIREAAAEIEAARSAQDRVARRRAEMVGVGKRMPDPQQTEELLGRAGRSAADLDGAVAALTAARPAAVAGRNDREALAAARVARDRLADAEAAVDDAHRRVAEESELRTAAMATREEAATTRATAQQAEDAAIARQEEADAALAEATAALHIVRHADMAATVRATLAAGEPCPVCEQPVVAVPKKRRAPALKAAEATLARAEKVAAEAAAETRAATAAVGSATTAEATAGERVAATERAAAAAEQRVVDVAAVRDQLAAAAIPADEVAAWEEALVAVEAARERFDQTGAALQRLAMELAGLAGRLDMALELPAEADAIAAARDRLRDAWSAAMTAADEEHAAAARDAEALAARRTELLAALGLAANADFEQELLAAGADEARLRERVEMLEERVARVAELEKENATAVGRLDTYRRLAADLAPARFLRFLLDEERAALADLGSERFQMLSDGRYRFTPGGEFDVVDLAAAESVRAAASLSGGETFLASLALALALAEMVSRTGGRLDAFFLDEGFGSLDGDHLDLAMQGIERLVADRPDRLVVVVSHLAEMRLRIEDLIQLDKDPLTGTTRVVRP